MLSVSWEGNAWSYHYKLIRSRLFMTERPKVLIFTQARSGSTYLMCLMSIREDVTFFNEPFSGVMRTQFVAGSGNVEDQLTNLMECEPGEMERQNREHPNRERTDCARSHARVIKTIRLRYWQMKSWIKQSDIKVFEK